MCFVSRIVSLRVTVAVLVALTLSPKSSSMNTIHAFVVPSPSSHRRPSLPSSASSCHRQRHQLSSRPSHAVNRDSSLRALVYGPDGNIVKDRTEEDDLCVSGGKDSPSGWWSSSTLSDLSLKDAVLSHAGTKLITTVACAFAPTPHDHLHPRMVVTAEVVRADVGSVDIALAVPVTSMSMSTTTTSSIDGPFSFHQLVQILVTVPLPQSHDRARRLQTQTTGVSGNDDNMIIVNDNNGSDDATDSVMAMATRIVQQLQELESKALEVIAHRDKQSHATASHPAAVHDATSTQRLLDALQMEPPAIDMPDWWTYAGLQRSLAEECTTLKSLLNEDDFATDLLSLCRMHHAGASGGDSSGRETGPFRLAKVAAIGPSGMLLKAAVFDDEDDDDDNIVQVAIPFVSQRRGTLGITADDLRDMVLTLVESVEQQPSPPPPPQTVLSSAIVTTEAAAGGNAAPTMDSVTAAVGLAQPDSVPFEAARIDNLHQETMDVAQERVSVLPTTTAIPDSYEVRLERTRRQMMQERFQREQSCTMDFNKSREKEVSFPVTGPTLQNRDDDDDILGEATTLTPDDSFSSRLEMVRRAMLHERLREQRRLAQHEVDAREERTRRKMLQLRLDHERRSLVRTTTSVHDHVDAVVAEEKDDNDDDNEYTSADSSSSSSVGPIDSSYRVVRVRIQPPKSPQEGTELTAIQTIMEDSDERLLAVVTELAVR